MVLVASSSPPPPRPTQRIPPLNPLGGPFWPREITDAPNENPVLATCWIACLFATFVLAFVLAGNGFKPQAIFACVVIGGLLTGYLRAKGSSKPTAQALLAGLGFAVVLLLVTPILLLGILFIGCAACAR